MLIPKIPFQENREIKKTIQMSQNINGPMNFYEVIAQSKYTPQANSPITKTIINKDQVPNEDCKLKRYAWNTEWVLKF